MCEGVCKSLLCLTVAFSFLRLAAREPLIFRRSLENRQSLSRGWFRRSKTVQTQSADTGFHWFLASPLENR